MCKEEKKSRAEKCKIKKIERSHHSKIEDYFRVDESFSSDISLGSDI